jgi:phenylacetate-CoA ligase
MSLDFRVRDYLFPLPILRLRSFLEKSQWFSAEKLEEYQMSRLKAVLNHSYENVPYYRRLLDGLGLKPGDFRRLEDLKKLPVLTKDEMRRNYPLLQARGMAAYRPHLCRTTGTTGEPVKFFLDKSSDVLEFCYYWRYWSWAGYRLHDPFAEFSLQHFIDTDPGRIHAFSRITNRLVLNPSRLSMENLGGFTAAIAKYRPQFVKGSPQSLYLLAILAERRSLDLRFRAAFTTGEMILPPHRKKIEEVFGCRLIDSYGHMERTVAVSQCPHGGYHINSEYGILETDERKELSCGDTATGGVVGTSLHNLAMPLIRYDVGDLIEVPRSGERCGCGRGLPLCRGIMGRTQDMVITPDGRILANLFILFNTLVGVKWAQIAQEEVDHIRVLLVEGEGFSAESERSFLAQLRGLVGEGVRVEAEHKAKDFLEGRAGAKYVPVTSRVRAENYL